MSTKHKVWVEIDSAAAKNNIRYFRSLLNKKTKLWAVVKSNAYGHGLVGFSLLAAELGVDGFCVDSVIEGLKLRKNGITKPVLVLGPTLPNLLPLAVKNGVTVTVSGYESLKSLVGKRTAFHLKIDTGMLRQGFYLKELAKVAKFIESKKLDLQGLYTHFASAKDLNYPTYTDQQVEIFLKGADLFKRMGFRGLQLHTAASGGTLINNRYHMDAVRCGIGLYGLWPSRELETQLDGELKPVLSWYTVISEIKDFNKGDFVGYDLTERMNKKGRLAVLPIGYWHGLSRGLSGKGEVLIRGKRAKILGRVCMDLVVVDVSDIQCSYGDRAIIIGKQGSECVSAEDIARNIGTINYEIITGINPLIKRIVV